jgi:hypothetical protein
MHEFPQDLPSPENFEAPDNFPSVEQMVADLRDYWNLCCGDQDEPNRITMMLYPFEDRYGYPDPQIVWVNETAEERQAEKTGAIPPERSLPRLASDIFDHQLTVEALAREGKPALTFEEVSGYPDPREAPTDAQPPASPEAGHP